MRDPQKPLSRMEEVQILLAEYNTLRTELLQRNTTAHQALGVGGTALIAISAYVLTQKLLAGLLLLAILVVLVWIVLRMFDFDSRQAAERIKELERAINERAGAKLLAWETNSGLLGENALTKRIGHVIAPPLAPIKWAWKGGSKLVRWLRQSD